MSEANEAGIIPKPKEKKIKNLYVLSAFSPGLPIPCPPSEGNLVATTFFRLSFQLIPPRLNGVWKYNIPPNLHPNTLKQETVFSLGGPIWVKFMMNIDAETWITKTLTLSAEKDPIDILTVAARISLSKCSWEKKKISQDSLHILYNLQYA